MPTILSRLRGLVAPVALDEPLRLADAGGVTPGPPSSGGSGPGSRGRPGDEGDRGRPGTRGRRGLDGAAGASGGTPPGAFWINSTFGAAVALPVNAVAKTINGSGSISRLIVTTDGGPGSLRIKVWKANIASHYPPTSADDITGGNDVVIASANTLDDSTLTGWTKTLAAGDVILFTLDSTSVFTSIGIALLI